MHCQDGEDVEDGALGEALQGLHQNGATDEDQQLLQQPTTSVINQELVNAL